MEASANEMFPFKLAAIGAGEYSFEDKIYGRDRPRIEIHLAARAADPHRQRYG